MKPCRGFTLIELLVVMVLIALLTTLAAPRYLARADDAREAALRHNLRSMREAIDQFYADRGAYPASLQALVDARYLRELPVDPMTQRRDSWVAQVGAAGEPTGLRDVHSGSRDRGRDGTEVRSW
jgi:general secretion pathway protein G